MNCQIRTYVRTYIRITRKLGIGKIQYGLANYELYTDETVNPYSVT